ncbi:MAG: leucine--tRNA ligase [Oscillospiraceae bacterium]|jgi:leucyl-tRNA synthetase|nr:leucine--tRNA ligase [Oscillospiraceae bacterium]
MKPYSQKVDQKWQARWDAAGLFRTRMGADDKKIYLLEMFSYPSASKLHLGHWWNYSLPDSWGRMKHMQGYDVFHPMGFDAFGLPAENFAIRSGIHPKDSTEANITTMEQQLRGIGCTYDWDTELTTCSPEYYKWTQWLFLQLYKHGLAYRKEAPVNWCDSCKTVLANEQASGGICERCGNEVLRKSMTQWFFKITDYAQELLDGLPALDWPEKTKRIQENWIGRSAGAEVTFDVVDKDLKITVFTSRVDTLMGLSYMVLAPESAYTQAVITPEYADACAAYIQESARKSEIERTGTADEKTGVFTGSYAVHPLTGQQVPIWLADYVIATYGTGAVMAVPAHDERDWLFANKYDLPILEVIADKAGERQPLPYCEHGTLVNSGKYDGLTTAEAKKALVADLAQLGRGNEKINYRLRDWSVSRQRYWGAPIPILYCPDCGAVPVPERDLPVELPYDVEFRPNGQSPLASHAGFRACTCPQCGKPAQREVDTMDTFVCSSWYYLRYPDAHNAAAPWDAEKAKHFMPVDKYVGGVEHAAMHLLYARFIYKALRDMGFAFGDEPFQSLVHQGVILGSDGFKMSKTRGNTVAPDDYVQKYGSDVFRLYLAFGFSYVDGGPWKDEGLLAIARFFAKFQTVVETFIEEGNETAPAQEDKELEYVRHNTIKSVTADIERFQFNTAVARLMELVTAIGKTQRSGHSQAYLRGVIEDFVRLVSPFAPHCADEMWEALGHSDFVYQQAWPVFDEKKLQLDTIELAVQVNGKLRDVVQVPATASQDEIKAAAQALPKIAESLAGKSIKKAIVVPGRLVNFVVG